MTQGIMIQSVPVLSQRTIVSIEHRIAPRPSTLAIARSAAGALLRFRLTKFIPIYGQLSTGNEVWNAVQDAYNSPAIDWEKLENEVYDAEDLNVFKSSFKEIQRYFVEETEIGVAAARNGQRYILIPSQIMPAIASVDQVGVEIYGNVLYWDPAGASGRRAAVRRGRRPAREHRTPGGPRLSWEEYPFAVTRGPRPGVHVDLVPIVENWTQGGFIRAADAIQGFLPNDAIHVFIL